MSIQILPLPAVADRLAQFAAASATARDRANDPDSQARFAALVRQYDQFAASVQAALGSIRTVRPAAGVSAERFWQAAGAAQRAIIERYGLRWAILAPIGETILVTVPPRLRSYQTKGCTTIRYRADHRLPAAPYWPGGVIPASVQVTADTPRHVDGPVKHDDAWHSAHGYMWHRGDWRHPQEVHRDRALAVHERMEAERLDALDVAEMEGAI